MPGTVASTGATQGKGEQNPRPPRADILIRERNEEHIVSFKVASATRKKQRVREIGSTRGKLRSSGVRGHRKAGAEPSF